MAHTLSGIRRHPQVINAAVVMGGLGAASFGAAHFGFLFQALSDISSGGSTCSGGAGCLPVRDMRVGTAAAATLGGGSGASPSAVLVNFTAQLPPPRVCSKRSPPSTRVDTSDGVGGQLRAHAGSNAFDGTNATFWRSPFSGGFSEAWLKYVNEVDTTNRSLRLSSLTRPWLRSVKKPYADKQHHQIHSEDSSLSVHEAWVKQAHDALKRLLSKQIQPC